MQIQSNKINKEQFQFIEDNLNRIEEKLDNMAAIEGSQSLILTTLVAILKERIKE